MRTFYEKPLCEHVLEAVQFNNMRLRNPWKWTYDQETCCTAL